MATCKDCVHVEVCREYVEGLAAARGVRLSVKELDSVLECDDCKHFKDRSRFVELPCKLGDTVYASWDMCKSFSAPRKIKGFVVDLILISDKTYIGFRACRKDEKDGCLYDIEFDLRDIGKTVFLTRKEAELALKERENNAN